MTKTEEKNQCRMKENFPRWIRGFRERTARQGLSRAIPLHSLMFSSKGSHEKPPPPSQKGQQPPYVLCGDWILLSKNWQGLESTPYFSFRPHGNFLSKRFKDLLRPMGYRTCIFHFRKTYNGMTHALYSGVIIPALRGWGIPFRLFSLLACKWMSHPEPWCHPCLLSEIVFSSGPVVYRKHTLTHPHTPARCNLISSVLLKSGLSHCMSRDNGGGDVLKKKKISRWCVSSPPWAISRVECL